MLSLLSLLSLQMRLVTFGPALLALVLGAGACTSKRELGNTLRFAIREKFKSLDPAHATDHYSAMLLRRSYEPLLQYHYLKRPYQIEPLLAEAMPQVSKDGLTYTFKLRKGVFFQADPAFGPESVKAGKGRELVAGDVVYTIKRWANPLDPSETWWAIDGKIAGLNQWAENVKKSGKLDWEAPVEGLKAVDAHTVQIKLTKPSPVFLHALTMFNASIVAREVVEHYGKEFGIHAVGTGPFQLQALTPNQLVWVRNPNYNGPTYPTVGSAGDKEAGRLADAGKPLPFVDKIVDDVIIEDQPAWLNFMQGNHDYMMRITKDNADDVFDAERRPKKELRDKGIQVFVEPGLWFNYIGFNQEDPVVGGEKNRWLRQALSLAVDEAPMIEKFYLGLAKKAEYPVPPGVPGYDPSYKNPYREYSLVRAREILAKAGHANGEGIPELTYATKSDMTFRQLGEYFQRQAALLGIKVRIDQMSWPELLAKARRKQHQVWGLTWIYDYPDAENGWQILYSRNESPGSNSTNYKNPKFDALYEKFALLPDGSERRKLDEKMRALYAEDVPFLITVHQAETRLAQSWVKNFKINSFDQGMEKYLRIDVQERSRALK